MDILAVAASSYFTLYPARVPAGTHLTDILAYSDCTIRNETLVDDGRADLNEIAKALAEKCNGEYRKWLVVITAGGKSIAVPTNHDMALMTVEMARRAKASPTGRN